MYNPNVTSAVYLLGLQFLSVPSYNISRIHNLRRFGWAIIRDVNEIVFFSFAIYLCFGIPPYFIGAYHRLIFRLAQNYLLLPDEASSGLLEHDFRFEMC